MNEQITKALMAMAQLMPGGERIDADGANMLAADLDGYETQPLLKALQRCRKELSRFPTLAQIVERIDDGRPGADEAWAMIPKDETASVVWCDEMREAWAVAGPLLETDAIAARMAFKEAYAKRLVEARGEKKPAKWTPSLGRDRSGRIAVLLDAVHTRRIPMTQAIACMPELPEAAPLHPAVLEFKKQQPALPILDEISADEKQQVKELVDTTRKKVNKHAAQKMKGFPHAQ